MRVELKFTFQAKSHTLSNEHSASSIQDRKPGAISRSFLKTSCSRLALFAKKGCIPRLAFGKHVSLTLPLTPHRAPQRDLRTSSDHPGPVIRYSHMREPRGKSDDHSFCNCCCEFWGNNLRATSVWTFTNQQHSRFPPWDRVPKGGPWDMIGSGCVSVFVVVPTHQW